MVSRVLITGGARGIGAAAARLLASQGVSVAVNYRAQAAAAEAVAVEARAAGVGAMAVPGDVADPIAVEQMFDAAETALGRLDGVVVNAGVLGPRGPLAELDPDRIRRVVDVNVTGAVLTAREAARRLSTARGGAGGAIVIVSSAAARLGSPNEFIDYAATKGATDTLTLGLARELGPEGVRVNAVRPGLIDTEIHADAGAPDRARVLAPSVPMRRAGDAIEVAQAVAWLLSDAASYVSGAILDVTGGR